MIRTRISKTEIEECTLKVLKDHYFHNIIPVPVDLMIEKLGVDIVPRKDMLKRIGIDACWNQDFTELHIDEDRYMATNNHRGRFTLAHEMGHYYLHKNHAKIFRNEEEWKTHILMKNPLRRIEEIEANDFAGFLLVPTKDLSLKFQELKDTEEYDDNFFPSEGISSTELMRYFSDDLSRSFKVSTYCMEIRIGYFKEQQIK